MTGGVLVVGYGNPLRTDDGIGWHAAQAAAGDPRLAGATVMAVHQLLPELALDLSQVSLAVLVDARVGPPAGSLTVERVTPIEGGSAWSHHLNPAAVAGMAGELYGHAPSVVVVSIGVASMEAGEHPSPEVEAAIPAVLDAIVELVASYEPTLTGGHARA